MKHRKARKNKVINDENQFLITLPDNITKTNEEIDRIINGFKIASNIEEQIGILRTFSSFLTSMNENSNAVIDVLSYLFVNSNYKNPIKKTILRIFTTAAINLNTQISNSLSKQLLILLKQFDLNINGYEEVNNGVNSINECFENFPLGVIAISLIVKDAIDFLINVYKKLVQDLSCVSSPILLQELIQYIHNCTRALVAVIQQCDDVKHLIPIYMNDFFKYSITVLNNENVSYDTKNNCGILLVTFVNVAENDYCTLLRMCLEENVEKWSIKSKDINNDLIVTCICSGVLNVIKPEQLYIENETFSKSILFVISETLLQLSFNSADNVPVVLGVNRSLLLLSRSLSSLNDEDLIIILNKLLDHIWTQLDHYVDTIRHLVKSMFINLVKLSTIRKNNGFNICSNVVINSAFALPVYRNNRYIGLSIIANELGVQVLLEKEMNLVVKLLEWARDLTISNHIVSCYENLMKNHIKEVDEQTWLQIWILPLTSQLSINDNEQSIDKERIYLQNLLIFAIKLRSSILDTILEQWSIYNEMQFCSLLKCVLIARKIGVKKPEINGKWRGIVDYNILHLAMCHQNDDIRVTSLSLIAECHKSTEIFNKFELEFIIEFLRYNINTQLPSTRQQILALFKKILSRFGESCYSITRNLNKPNNDNSFLYQQQKQDYVNFIHELRICVFDNLFPGANFSRRILCLEILILMESILKMFEFSMDKLWRQSEVELLLMCLSDSYESNKHLAVTLLKQCPVELLHLKDAASTKHFVEKALILASSVKPADSTTAAYMLETSFYSPVLHQVLKTLTQITIDYTVDYLMIRLLLQKLQNQVEIARANLLKAAGSTPMHGLLFCVRHHLEKYLTSSIIDNTWKHLIDELIATCFVVNEIVGPVVNNSSPEGHLPMDQAVCVEDDTVTSQMLLVCSWRSVKEVSLILGEIALKAPIENDVNCKGANTWVTEEQMLKIGEHFTILLTETKHRGAFEQAYVGFTKLCTRLWKCSSEVLHQLPVNWLNDILYAILEGNNVRNIKLCATRRSAGVPFMIQAIIATEIKSGGFVNFHRCISKLLEYASLPDDVHAETRTHAMNILRAIYRHTQLGEMVTQYVAEGVTIGIIGFSKNSWAERNSATLLFASLMTRIFGVQRTRHVEQLSIRNRMTGRVFFQRHPILHAFLLEQLQKIMHDERVPAEEIKLYPILLLLARLYSTTTEDNNICNQLEDFVPYVKKCAGNKVLKTRELAARALVSIIPAQKQNDLLNELFEILQRKNLNDNNHLHGILLQIFHLLRSTVNIEQCLDIDTTLKQTEWILHCDNINKCLITTSLYMQIIILITSKIDLSIHKSINYQNLPSIILKQDNFIDKNYFIGKTLYQRTAINLLLILQLQNNEMNTNFNDLIITNLKHDSLVVKEFILNFLMCILQDSNTKTIVDNFEIPEQEKSLADLFFKKKMNKILQFDQLLIDVLKSILNIAKDNALISKALIVLSNSSFAISKISNDFNYYLENFNLNNDQISCAVLCCVRTTFLQNIIQLENMELDKVFDVFLKFSSLDYNLNCRYCVALILKENSQLIFNEKLKLENLFKLWQTIMNLLEDGEPVVRNTISFLARNSPIAEKCREYLLENCIKFLKPKFRDNCIALLLFWAFIDRDSVNEEDDIDDVQVFEKGETSTYIETMPLSKLSAKYLSEFQSTNSSSILILDQIIKILQTNEIFWTDHLNEKQMLITILRDIKNRINESEIDVNVILNEYFSEDELCTHHQNDWKGCLNNSRKYKLLTIIKYLLHLDITSY